MPTNRPRSSTCGSLPQEVQIQVHIPIPEERPSIRLVDSKDSWGLTPPRAYFRNNDVEEPTGYISPLEEEEEEFTRRRRLSSASPGEGTNTSVTTTSPEGLVSTRSEEYAADVDSPQNNSNPQDSLCEDDSREEGGGDQENHPAAANSFENSSPFAKLKAPPAIPDDESWMWSWVNKTTTAVTPTASDVGSVVETKKSRGGIKTVYLPKNVALAESWKSQHATKPEQGIALSGWAAFGLGDHIIQKLTIQGENLEREDITHFVLPIGSNKLWISTPNGSFEAVDLTGCRVEVNEISRDHGRALYLKRIKSGETMCTLLPVCLPENYDGGIDTFGDGSVCFPEGAYLPDDQQYTTMHIMFALDALLKAKQGY